MWMTGWLLGFIPDSVFIWFSYVLAGLGVALYILSKIIYRIPLLSQYKLPTELLGIILLVVGAFVFGSYGTEMIWRERVKEAEAKIKAAEERAPVITKQIVTKYKDKIFVVKQGVEVIKKEIEVKREIINEGCKLNPTAVEIYNKGITGDTGEAK